MDAAHRRDGVARFLLHRPDQPVDLLRRRGGPLRQRLHVGGDDRECLALLAGLRRDDRGVQ
jgi:hypothetical protein